MSPITAILNLKPPLEPRLPPELFVLTPFGFIEKLSASDFLLYFGDIIGFVSSKVSDLSGAAVVLNSNSWFSSDVALASKS